MATYPAERGETACARCRRLPADISSVATFAEMNGTSPDGFIRAEEGTFDPGSGLFLCDQCYIKAGQPAGRVQWTATPGNLAAIGIRW